MTPEQQLNIDIEALVNETLNKLGPISRWVNLKPYVDPFTKAIVKMSSRYVEAKLRGCQKMISKSIIVAFNKKLTIGKEGKLLWHDKEDLKRFKALTIDHPIIMGRKTHESIGRTLPNRENIIVSRNQEYIPLGQPAYVVQSLRTAFLLAEDLCRKTNRNEIFVIGGEEIYTQALPSCNTLYVSDFNDEQEGDAYFPPLKIEEWEEKVVEITDTHKFKMFTRVTE